MTLKHWMLIRKICLAYFTLVLALFALELVVMAVSEYGSKPTDYVGCYAYDALLVGFKCSGFQASELVSFALNYPLYHLYMPFFVFWNPLLILVLLAMYSPLVMLLISNGKVVSARV
ncbi:hypothetical protein EYR97_21765 [Alteromonas sp. KUL42]|nr:hypothetical protein EYR97_21765 [Alteromonas sp. KUL42]